MKRKFHHRFHKWLGIPVCLLMFLFCLSGIVLNHRQFFSRIGVSRSFLPQRYHYTNWNNGLLRGTLTLPADSTVLLYGSSGIFHYSNTSPNNFQLSTFNFQLKGDFRRIVALPNGQLVAVTPFIVHFLQLNPQSDSSLFTLLSSLNMGERLSDVETHGDTLIVVGRSHLFLSTAPNYSSFQKITLPPPSGGEYPRQTLFRTVWQLHSGELFGLPGRLIVDAIALIILFLSITGLLLLIRSRSLSTIKWHDALGRYTIILTIFVVITGAFLRPPLMIPLVLTKTPQNSWHDKLRMLRYDDITHQWLLHTSAGFYSISKTQDHFQLSTFNFDFVDTAPALQSPSKLGLLSPNRSVQLSTKIGLMGLSVWEKGPDGHWIFGEAPYVSGYSADLGEPFFVYYGEGTDRLPQPPELESLPMSLWNLCLELHTGRLLLGAAADYFYVFLSGILTIWVLIAGWKIRRHKHGFLSSSHSRCAAQGRS